MSNESFRMPAATFPVGPLKTSGFVEFSRRAVASPIALRPCNQWAAWSAEGDCVIGVRHLPVESDIFARTGLPVVLMRHIPTGNLVEPACVLTMKASPAQLSMLENLGLVVGVVLILLGVLLSYFVMQSIAAEANLMLLGGAVMFALGMITTAIVLKSKREFRRHYKKHRRE